MSDEYATTDAMRDLGLHHGTWSDDPQHDAGDPQSPRRLHQAIGSRRELPRYGSDDSCKVAAERDEWERRGAEVAQECVSLDESSS